MGYKKWSDDEATQIQQSNSTKAADDIFVQNTKQQIKQNLSPINLTVRESCDSDEHPESVPIMIVLDVTGSMGVIPEYLIKNNLPKLMEIIINHGTKDPQIMFSAIGDQGDRAPLQVGQFESAAPEINECLSSIWIEGDGRGNHVEAYSLGWLIAGRHTKLDSFEKRGQKGILFTIGDEACHKIISASRLKEIMGYTEANDLQDKEILEEAKRLFHIFHIHAEQGSYPSRSSGADIVEYWRSMLPERVILMEDYTELAEIIGTTVAMVHGSDLDSITKGFDPKTAGDVTKALAKIDVSMIKQNHEEGVLEIA